MPSRIVMGNEGMVVVLVRMEDATTLPVLVLVHVLVVGTTIGALVQESMVMLLLLLEVFVVLVAWYKITQMFWISFLWPVLLLCGFYYTEVK